MREVELIQCSTVLVENSKLIQWQIVVPLLPCNSFIMWKTQLNSNFFGEEFSYKIGAPLYMFVVMSAYKPVERSDELETWWVYHVHVSEVIGLPRVHQNLGVFSIPANKRNEFGPPEEPFQVLGVVLVLNVQKEHHRVVDIIRIWKLVWVTKCGH